MALTFGDLYTVDAAKPSPQKTTLAAKLVICQVTLDSSYPTGGEAMTAANFGLDQILTVFAQSMGGYVFSWDSTNSKLLAYRSKDPGDAGGADIVLQQVANATDLSGVTLWALAIGI